MPEPTQNVKPSELPAVLTTLRSLGAPSLDLRNEPRPLGGGFWAEMWTLQLRDQGDALPERVVLRLAPDSMLAESETAVQRAVADQGFPTPRILASANATATSRFWAVMEHADGAPLLAGLSGISALARLPRLARELPTQLASVSASLHELDVARVETRLRDCADPRHGVDGLLDHYATTVRDLQDTSLIRAVDELAEHRPPARRNVVCHGDLHPFNVLQNDGELTVLDWTAARIADPAFDIAFSALLLSNPPLDAPRLVRPTIRRAARVLSRRFIRAYDTNVGEPIDRAQLEWHTRLHSVRVLTDLAVWSAEGTLAAHRGHPWFTMEAPLRVALMCGGSD